MLFFLLLLLLLLFPLLLPLLPLLVLKPNHYTIALHLFTITRLLVASLFFSFSPPPPPFLRRSIHLIEESKFLWARSVAPILSIVLPQTSHSLFLFFSFPLWMIFTRTFQPPSFTSLIFLPSIRSFPSFILSLLISDPPKKKRRKGLRTSFLVRLEKPRFPQFSLSPFSTQDIPRKEIRNRIL